MKIDFVSFMFVFVPPVCLFISILLFDSKKRSLDFSITQKLKKKKYTHVFSFCYSNYRLPVELMCLYMFIFFSSGCWFLANSIVLSLFFLSCLCICSLRTSRYSFIEIKKKLLPDVILHLSSSNPKELAMSFSLAL